MVKKKVSVALCTYNGEEFLPLQFKSIIDQKLPPDEIVCCDDLSSDQTARLFESFSSNVITPVRFYSNERNIGVVDNYSRAISLCKGDYVALCDQDDIWLPEKLAITMQRMKETEEIYGTKTPLLVHTNLSVIDATNNIIAPSFMKLRKLQPIQKDPLKALLAQNFVTGCTVLINRSLIDIALPIPEEAVMHDWWLALVAAVRGIIIYEPQPTVLYRKHGKNVIGVKGYYSEENVARLLDIKRLKIELAGAINQALVLLERLESLPGGDVDPDIVRFLHAARQGGTRAVAAALRGGIKKAGLLRSMLYYLLLLKGGYKDKLRSN